VLLIVVFLEVFKGGFMENTTETVCNAKNENLTLRIGIFLEMVKEAAEIFCSRGKIKK
jgi:hypothetical protein